MSKELYSLEEVFSMNDKKFVSTYGVTVKSKGDILLFENDRDWKECTLSKTWLDSKYKLVENKPVVFDEVLKSDKRCRVEHRLTHYRFYSCEYRDLNTIMYYLNQDYCNKEFKEIVRYGNWYLEE